RPGRAQPPAARAIRARRGHQDVRRRPGGAERDRGLSRVGSVDRGPRCARLAPPIRGELLTVDGGPHEVVIPLRSEATAASASFAGPLDLLAVELLIRIPERY